MLNIFENFRDFCKKNHENRINSIVYLADFVVAQVNSFERGTGVQAVRYPAELVAAEIDNFQSVREAL